MGSGIIFIALNVCDAYLTKIALSMGAAEFNPLVITWGSSLIAKGLIAALVVLLLYFFNKGKWLWAINMLFLGVVLWNLAVCMVIKVGLV